ncbi:TetR/AcrR family transcriptional regulator [Crossiella sp. SN42]|uniref:TetR/AcrR family transcriptional regulator n=1 Tax=Crossiella sp. SN42 TaxID=2944808 RepID=UPI00207D499C|nr:TetR/AcrR family transcriptional regulator [Crossiella sp. SN42]MCO1581195.1 TetR/AcrR family transcriptional regulator [Crossiella sp. SN42]
MAQLLEQDSGKAARILAAARELLLRRGVKGVTIAEIAERAHVGKGTVYLYWGTKEDLFVGLFAREFLAAVDEMIELFSTDPDAARPHRFCPVLVRTALERPFMRALQTGDADSLGILLEHPRSKELMGSLGPSELMHAVLPVWRAHQLARTDWPVDEQAYALRALLAGFFQLASSSHALNEVTVAEPDRVISAAVTALLGEPTAGAAEIRATAEEGLRLLHARRADVLATITTTKE